MHCSLEPCTPEPRAKVAQKDRFCDLGKDQPRASQSTHSKQAAGAIIRVIADRGRAYVYAEAVKVLLRNCSTSTEGKFFFFLLIRFDPRLWTKYAGPVYHLGYPVRLPAYRVLVAIFCMACIEGFACSTSRLICLCSTMVSIPVA